MSITFLNSTNSYETIDNEFLDTKTKMAILKILGFVSILAFGIGFVLMPYFM